MRCLGGQEMMPMSIVRNGNLMNCHHIWYISNVWFIHVCMEIGIKTKLWSLTLSCWKIDILNIFKPFIFNSIYIYIYIYIFVLWFLEYMIKQKLKL
jgi:hypothetical protein